MSLVRALPLLLVVLPALAACGSGDDRAGGKPAITITAADRAAAQQKFQTLCFTCHGMQGGGDGPAATGLNPPPRNFHDAQWQASVTDEHIETIIVGGGASVGKSIAMPSNPDLKAKPGVVAALREYVRSFGEGSN